MNGRRVRAVLSKDLVDALRDGRVVIALLLPILLAVIYNATAPERGERPTTQIAVAAPEGAGLVSALEDATRQSVELEVRRVDREQSARRLVEDDDVDLAVIATAEQAQDARATVIVPDDASATTQAVAAIVPDAVTAAAGRSPAAQVRVESVELPTTGKPAVQVIEPKALFIAGSIVLLAGFVALLIVPLQTAEELETGTFGALRMAMPTSEVLIAKGVGGMIYGAVGTAIIVGITRADPADVVQFGLAALLLVASLVGFGLLLGLVSRNANQINTYASFLLFPVVGIAGAVLFVEGGGVVATILDVLPFSQAMKLLVDGLAPERPFSDGIVPWVVVVAWAVAGLVVVQRYASRREV